MNPQTAQSVTASSSIGYHPPKVSVFDDQGMDLNNHLSPLI